MFSAERYKSLNEFPGYDTKQSDCEAPVILKCRIPLHYHCSQVHSGSVVAPDRVLSMDQIELFDQLTMYKEMADV